LLSAFGSRFSEHIQSNATLYTDLAADPVHTLLHLPVAAIATFHRIGGRGQQRVVEQCQGFFQMRREDLFSGLANPGEPVDPLPQLLQLAQGRLRPATPVTQRIKALIMAPAPPAAAIAGRRSQLIETKGVCGLYPLF
jgi:hypothetical protein